MRSYHSAALPVTGGFSRRAFLITGAATGGGLLVSVVLPRVVLGAESMPSKDLVPNAFVRIGHDGLVTVTVPYVEMGQGTYTSIPMLIAEELEVGLDRIAVAHAPADEKDYANPLLGMQATGASTSVMAAWEPMRQAGATARVLLVAAAARIWGVDPASCRAAKGAVVHSASQRTLAYGDLVDEAATLPIPTQVTLKDPKDFTLIGTPAKRTDQPGKVDGTAVFGIDTKLPGMKIATVAACPVIGGTLGQVDDGKAKAVRGVLQIVRLDDAVAVIAEHMGAALKGLAALDITWNEGANAAFSSADLMRQLDQASQSSGAVAQSAGDVAAALKSAAKTLDAVYQMPLLAHATMEPMNCTVEVRPDSCEVWTGSQVMARAQAAAAQVTGLPLDSVTVHNNLLGGGFGRRLEVDYVIQAVRIAKQVEGPVKVVWTREEDIQHDIYRPCYYDRFSAGLDAQGRLMALSHRVVGSSIIARWVPELFKNGVDFDAVAGAAGPYGIPNLLVDYVRHEPPVGLTTGFWRGVGVTHNVFMLEGFMDELAVLTGQDPVAYRRALLDQAPRARAVLDAAAKLAGWGGTLPAGRGRGVSLFYGFGSYMAQVAEVTVDKNGQVRVERVVCTVDCGRVVNPDTIEAQVQSGIVFGLTAALYGEITLKNGRVEQDNFDSYQILRIDEAPTIDVEIIASDEAPGGIGEPATAGVGPAVVNAIHAATGKRLRKLPIDTTALKVT